MPLIKRYPNRKLYDTAAKQYITLDTVADLIRQGQEVRVIDHATGYDLTAITLTQIILEEEKKRGGFLPAAVLAGLVRAGGKTADALRRALSAPLNLAHQVDEEIARRIEALATNGSVTEEEADHLRERLLASPTVRPRLPTDGELEEILRRLKIPTRSDLAVLEHEVDRLEARVVGSVVPPADREQP